MISGSNGKIDFDIYILHVKQLVYVTFTSFKGNMYSSIYEFAIMKCFDIKCRPHPAPRIIQVNWCFPSHNWIKCNTNGVSKGTPRISTCGGIFMDGLGTFLGVFSYKIGVHTSFQAEFMESCLLSNMLIGRIR